MTIDTRPATVRIGPRMPAGGHAAGNLGTMRFAMRAARTDDSCAGTTGEGGSPSQFGQVPDAT
jgi:hypothetical protein